VAEGAPTSVPWSWQERFLKVVTPGTYNQILLYVKLNLHFSLSNILRRFMLGDVRLSLRPGRAARKLVPWQHRQRETNSTESKS